jgi:hypothetical protein
MGLDRVKVAALVSLAFLAAACDRGGRPSRLLNGDAAAEFRPVRGSVLTEGRILRRGALGRRFESCLPLGDRANVAGDAIVVERTSVDGESLTFANRTHTGVYACDGGIDSAGERGPPWCGEAFGALADGRLLDPRLDVICRDRSRAPLAYAFVDPIAGTHWIGVDQGRYTEIYEVLAGLPVRIAGTRRIDTQKARATFEVTQYDLQGRELVRGRLEAAVAG